MECVVSCRKRLIGSCMQLNSWCVPPVCVLLWKNIANFLLPFIPCSFYLYKYNFYYFIFYILFLLFVNCTLFLFFSCVCAKKCDVGCIFYSLFFCYHCCFFCYHCLYRRIPLQFCFIFYIFRPHRYARHRMRPATIDVVWSVCVCLLDRTVNHVKSYEPSRCRVGCGVVDQCPFLLCSRGTACVELNRNSWPDWDTGWRVELDAAKESRLVGGSRDGDVASR